MFEGTRLELAIPSCSVSESIDSLVEEMFFSHPPRIDITRATKTTVPVPVQSYRASTWWFFRRFNKSHRFAAPKTSIRSTKFKRQARLINVTKMSRLTRQKKYTLGSNGYITIYVRLHRLRLDSLLEFSWASLVSHHDLNRYGKQDQTRSRLRRLSYILLPNDSKGWDWW